MRRVAVAAEVERERPIPLTAQPREHLVPAVPRPGEAVEQDEGLGHADTMTSARDSHLLLRALADELARCGIAGACTSPGSRSAPLVLALVRDGRFPCFSHVDERSAAFFALGLAKASGRPAVLACTSGTAAANYLPGDRRGARGAGARSSS